MDGSSSKPPRIRQGLLREMVEYWITFAYLTLVFAAFTQYGRLVLAAHDVSYTKPKGGVLSSTADGAQIRSP